MCIRTCPKGLISVLLALVVYAGQAFLYQPAAALSLEPTPPDTGISRVPSDLDGDGLPDSVTVSTGGFQNAIELQLSRTSAHMVLPFNTTPAGAFGSLSAQDVDRDGDTDLLWQETLPPYQVIVWLNDGAGRFECLCPLEPQDQRVELGGSGLRAPHARNLDRIGSPTPPPSSGQALAYSWEFHAPTISGRPRLEPVWGLFAPLPLLTTRGPPPLMLC